MREKSGKFRQKNWEHRHFLHFFEENFSTFRKTVNL